MSEPCSLNDWIERTRSLLADIVDSEECMCGRSAEHPCWFCRAIALRAAEQDVKSAIELARTALSEAGNLALTALGEGICADPEKFQKALLAIGCPR